MDKVIERRFALISIWFAAMVSAYAQYQLNVYGNELMEIYKIGTVEFAALFSAPMLPAIFLSFIVGKISDIVGARKIIGIALLLSVIGLFGRLSAETISGMMAAMAVTGMSSIAVSVNAAKILGKYFEVSSLTLVMGFYTTGSMLAQAFATATSSVLFPNMKAAFNVAFIFGIVITIVWCSGLIVFPEVKKDEQRSEKTSLIEVITNGGIWLTGLCLMFTLGATVTLNTFLPTALSDTGKFTQAQTGTIASMISLGNLLGAIIGPILYKKLRSLKVFLCTVGIAAAIGCAFAWRIDSILLLLIVMLLTGIVLGGAMPTYFSMPASLKGISKENISTAGGLITTLQLAGAVVIPTYILVPIAGGNFNVMFILAGVCMLMIPVLSFGLSKKIHRGE
ncbi:MFS transporter [Lachnospiraceae bacterium OttesenSCG-928-J05]|nr:MFS transporter [Lachnospiraceae bacterium OttesenSCG-928-J05]